MSRHIEYTLPDGFVMPEFIKDPVLRKGPVNQNTLSWMKKVQFCLDWDITWSRRDSDGTYLMTIDQRPDPKKKPPSSDHPTPSPKNFWTWMREDFQPAIDALTAQEKTCRQDLTDDHRMAYQAAILKCEQKEHAELKNKLASLRDNIQALRSHLVAEQGGIARAVERDLRDIEWWIFDLMENA